MHYFAYGSNMATRIMHDWGAACTSVGPAQLVGYRLAFTQPSQRWGGGAADVIAADGAHVWGVLYQIDADSLAALDRKERLGVAYQHLVCDVLLPDGTPCPALTYTVIHKADPELCPAPAYKATILEGALEHHLPQTYIAFLQGLETSLQFR